MEWSSKKIAVKFFYLILGKIQPDKICCNWTKTVVGGASLHPLEYCGDTPILYSEEFSGDGKKETMKSGAMNVKTFRSLTG